MCGTHNRLLSTTIENALTKKNKLGHVLWEGTESHTRAELMIIKSQYGWSKHWLKAGGQTWRKPCGLGF